MKYVLILFHHELTVKKITKVLQLKKDFGPMLYVSYLWRVKNVFRCIWTSQEVKTDIRPKNLSRMYLKIDEKINISMNLLKKCKMRNRMNFRLLKILQLPVLNSFSKFIKNDRYCLELRNCYCLVSCLACVMSLLK